MTRWGYVAYYFAAWLLGSLFIGLAEWLASPVGAGFDFFFFYYSALTSNVLSCLLFGFLLHVACARATRFALPTWVVIGIVLLTLQVALLGRIAAALERAVPAAGLRHFLYRVSLQGPLDFSHASLWLPSLVGAATAFLLYLFHRAFQPAPQA